FKSASISFFCVRSVRYRFWNSGHLSRSWPNHFRSSSLGAISFIQTSTFGLVLFHAARPQSIHEHAPPVTLLCWLIDSLDLNHIHTRHSTRYILSASEQPIHLFIQNRALKIFGVVTIIEKRFCNFARRTERRSRGSRTEARPR